MSNQNPGGQQTFTQWQVLPPYGVGSPGAPVQSGGGGGFGPGSIVFRDKLDAMRSGYYQGPSDYPDGYLGTIENRRGDRLLKAVQGRENERAYQRGVHKGERIDYRDYFWPKQWYPELGLELQEIGVKNPGIPQELPNLKLAAMMGARSGNATPNRHEALRRMAPDWR